MNTAEAWGDRVRATVSTNHFKLTITFEDQAPRWYYRIILDNHSSDWDFRCVNGCQSDLAGFLENGYGDQDSYGFSVDKFISRLSSLIVYQKEKRAVIVNTDDFMKLKEFCSNKLTDATANFEEIPPFFPSKKDYY